MTRAICPASGGRGLRANELFADRNVAADDTVGPAALQRGETGLGPRGKPLGNDPMMICDPIGYPRIMF
jgi:hypothetical protein